MVQPGNVRFRTCMQFFLVAFSISGIFTLAPHGEACHNGLITNLTTE